MTKKELIIGFFEKGYCCDLDEVKDSCLDLLKENKQLKIQISAREEEYKELEDKYKKLDKMCELYSKSLYNAELNQYKNNWNKLKEIAKRAGFDYLICTHHNEKTGAIIGENCRGEEKVRRLNEEFKDYKIVDVYSDSYKHDKYIFSLAEGSCYHIEKGKRVEFKYKEKYGE